MTCVIGLIHNGDVWMAGDSAGTNESGTMNGQTKKVWRQGAYLIGFAGTYGLGQAVKRLELPWEDVANPQDWIETTFAGFLSESIFHDFGDEEALIVGFKGHLFQLDNHYGVFEPVLPYIGIGDGAAYGMGSIYSTAERDPAHQLHEALSAASFFHPGSVRPPFTILGPELENTVGTQMDYMNDPPSALHPIGNHIHHV